MKKSIKKIVCAGIVVATAATTALPVFAQETPEVVPTPVETPRPVGNDTPATQDLATEEAKLKDLQDQKQAIDQELAKLEQELEEIHKEMDRWEDLGDQIVQAEHKQRDLDRQLEQEIAKLEEDLSNNEQHAVVESLMKEIEENAKAIEDLTNERDEVNWPVLDEKEWEVQEEIKKLLDQQRPLEEEIAKQQAVVDALKAVENVKDPEENKDQENKEEANKDENKEEAKEEQKEENKEESKEDSKKEDAKPEVKEEKTNKHALPFAGLVSKNGTSIVAVALASIATALGTALVVLKNKKGRH